MSSKAGDAARAPEVLGPIQPSKHSLSVNLACLIAGRSSTFWARGQLVAGWAVGADCAGLLLFILATLIRRKRQS